MASSHNIYKEDVDFAALALQDAEFAQVLKPNNQLDFTSPSSVQQLTKSLLRRDFNLKIELPPDRLCPPVPNRLNYLLWIQALLDTTSDSYNDVYESEREVTGLDIGTGASCIYPLLGCALRAKWRFIGTDIDEKSLQFARKNVEINGLQNRIKVLGTKSSDELLATPLDGLGIENIDFCMCNPPFYTSKDEMIASATTKQRPPFTACTGSENEMIYPGGEVAFVSRFLSESLVLKERVQWYSTMLGKFSSISELAKKLKENGIENFAVTEFVQGSKTRRWGVAWSFGDLRPCMSAARGVSSLQKQFLPFPSEFLISSNISPSVLGQRVHESLSQLALKWVWKSNFLTGIGFSNKAVWSRLSRRRLAIIVAGDENEDVALGFKVVVEANAVGLAGSKAMIRWIKGHDKVLFESFCEMLRRKIEGGEKEERRKREGIAT